jgi:lysophospholipase L1-like esterase
MSRAAHEQLLQKAKQGTIDIYFQGDSVTRRWGATDYPKLLQHWNESFYGWNAANFAWGGDNTHHILWRMQNGELDGLSPKVVVLQAGTNNLPWRGAANQETIDDVVDGVAAIIQEFQQRVPDAVIVLTGLFPRDQNAALTPAIKEINARLRSLTNERQVRFLSLNALLTDSEGRFLPGYSSDGLHLEKPAYQVWAAALRPVFQEVLGPPAAKDQAPSPTGVPSKTDP